MLRVELKGDRELNRLIDELNKKADGALQQLLAEGAINTENVAKRSIQGHQSQGNTYQRRKAQHTASKPGSPPNSDTGNLVKNITVQKIPGGYDVGSRTGAPYGLWLEFGTLRTAARPWLQPAFDAVVKPLIEKYRRRGL